jgi:hypothetical protein
MWPPSSGSKCISRIRSSHEAGSKLCLWHSIPQSPLWEPQIQQNWSLPFEFYIYVFSWPFSSERICVWHFTHHIYYCGGARGSVVGWGTMLQAERSRGSIPDQVTRFFISPNFSSSTVVLGSTHPLTEMSTWNLPGGKGLPARKAKKLTTKLCADWLENVRASTSHHPISLHGLLQG